MASLKSLLIESFTRQHYEAVAKILSKISQHSERRKIATQFIEMFKKDNASFNEKLFIKACGLSLKDMDDLKHDSPYSGYGHTKHGW
jgi:hypothetical protein